MSSSVLVLLLEDTLHRLARDIAWKSLDHHHVVATQSVSTSRNRYGISAKLTTA
jgi:hypothetical protein